MTEVTFTVNGNEGRIDISEGKLEYDDPKDVDVFYTLLAKLKKEEIDGYRGPDETFSTVTQIRVDVPDELALERVEEGLEYLGAEYSVEKSKSVFPPYVNRENKLRSTAQDIPQEYDDKIRDAFKEQIWPEELNKSPSWASDDDVTESTQEWVDAVFELRDPLYDAYSGVPQAAALRVKGTIREALTQPQGWSLDSVVSNLEKEFDFMDESDAKRIARQEIAATLNEAMEISFEARPEEPIVRWVGPSDQDTTELCQEIKEEIGDGVPMDEAEQIIQEKSREYEYGTPERADQLIPHWLCRHTLEEAE